MAFRLQLLKVGNLFLAPRKLIVHRRMASSFVQYWDSKSMLYKITALGGGFGVGTAIWSYFSLPDANKIRKNVVLSEKTNFTVSDINLDVIPSREVTGPADLGLELLLFQYQTCPFCCKVRAFLQFYGIPFKVVEVNPVMRQQLKFSKYKKVPILIAQEKESPTKLQLNDSSAIISILGTFIMDVSEGLESILKNYIPMVYTDSQGKEVEEVMNRYFLMYGNGKARHPDEELVKSERQWRKWADAEFVHVLSPNIYRSFGEALESFRYFSSVGDWERNFSTMERLVVIYVGAAAMFLIGKRLKKKYSLKEDVRQSLYDACKHWTRGMGKKKFMGGNSPNLADLFTECSVQSKDAQPSKTC